MDPKAIEFPESSESTERELKKEWHRTHPFRNSAFVKLWLGQLLGLPALHIVFFAMIIQVFHLTGSNGLVGTLIAVISIPPILFSSIGGVLADHINRKILMVGSNAARLVFAILLFFFHDSVLAIMFLSFGIASLTFFFQPAENSSIPGIVGKKNLLLGNSIYMFTFYVATFLGYTIAGPAIEWIGVKTLLMVVIGMFGSATILDVLLPKLSETKWKHAKLDLGETARRTWHGMREGIVAMKGHHALQLTMLQLIYIFNVERAIVALVPDLTLNYFKISIGQISLFLIGPLGLGAALAVVAVHAINRRFTKRQIINAGMLGNALFFFLLPIAAFSSTIFNGGGQTPLKILSMIVLALMAGFADILIMVTAQTLLHEQVDDATRGRIVGNLLALMNGLGVPVILLIGWLTNFVSAPHVILGTGILTFGIWWVCASFSKKELVRAETKRRNK
ncbi:MAG: MFS transporter [Candidatus Kerfeldbacteria bacterium]|nr:MFS transporter [Candidatus Kerfeldbacteria bacterium]